MIDNAREAGQVLVRFVVGANGKVEQNTFEILRYTHVDFIPPTRTMLFACVLRPGRLDGVPVRVRVEMPVIFALRVLH